MERASLIAIAAALFACGSDPTVDPRQGECQDYCDLVIEHCVGDYTQYSDRDTCLATCEAMPLGSEDDRAGHTIACRTFNAAIAELSPAMTCTKAGPGGDGTCGENCESFCAMQAEICTGENAQFRDTDCMTTCAMFDATLPYDIRRTAGNTLACRIYHMTAAATDPDFHCPHLALMSETCDDD